MTETQRERNPTVSFPLDPFLPFRTPGPPTGITRIVFPLRRPSNVRMPERCSPARVRYAAPKAARPCRLCAALAHWLIRRAAPAGTRSDRDAFKEADGYRRPLQASNRKFLLC